MSEQPEIVVSANTEGFVQALKNYARANRVDLASALPDGARAFLWRVLRFTPPPTRRTGSRAVQRDIQRAIAPLRASAFDDRGFRRAVRGGRLDLLQRLFERLPPTSPLAGYRVVPFSPSYHQEARDARGRVRRKGKLLTLDIAELRSYIKRIQGRVGWAKGAWARSAGSLQVPVLPWAARFGALAGEYYSNLNNPFTVAPKLVMTAHSNYAVSEETRIIRNAMNEATKAVVTAATLRQRVMQRKLAEETARAEMKRAAKK